MSKEKIISSLALFACFFALGVIGLGAFTRLIDAGLGCPDWPGCYGHLIPTDTFNPQFVMYKAWAEMVHRYFVAGLSIFILILITLLVTGKRKQILLAASLLFLLVYQIMLGRWTITLKLSPVIVTQHLLGGFFILSILWLIYLNNKYVIKQRYFSWLTAGAFLALFFLLIQIFLGAWTSTHYASLSCPNFPFCFNTPDGPLKTIHLFHRLGALILTCYLFIFLIGSVVRLHRSMDLMRQVFLMFGVLLLQICLGIMNVVFKLPLYVAIGHTLTAALLLLALISFIYQLMQVRLT